MCQPQCLCCMVQAGTYLHKLLSCFLRHRDNRIVVQLRWQSARMLGHHFCLLAHLSSCETSVLDVNLHSFLLQCTDASICRGAQVVLLNQATQRRSENQYSESNCWTNLFDNNNEWNWHKLVYRKAGMDLLTHEALSNNFARLEPFAESTDRQSMQPSLFKFKNFRHTECGCEVA